MVTTNTTTSEVVIHIMCHVEIPTRKYCKEEVGTGHGKTLYIHKYSYMLNQLNHCH